ncbi:MAG TPA: hypothetical protein VF032_19570 [Thermoleophilaceae bacterium]
MSQSDSDRPPIRVPEGVNVSLGNIIRKATMWGQGWSAEFVIEAESPGAMNRALDELTRAIPEAKR